MEVNNSKPEVNEPVMDYNLLDLNGAYTYRDYLHWLFKERVELIRGKLIKMSPAPNNIHQEILFNLNGLLYNLFHGSPCKVYPAPFDVVLPVPLAQKDTTVVQPDFSIVCDMAKLDGHGCKGAPDLVVEILSPGNSQYDLRVKFDVYEESGVREYWIVDPHNRSVLLYILQEGKYIGLHPFATGDTIESVIFTDLKVKVDDIFSGVD